MKTDKLKKMSFAEQVWRLKVVSGAAWIFVGAFSCFDNPVCTVLHVLALLILPINIIYIALAKRENSDEMAEENLNMAKAKTLDIMQVLFGVGGIAALLLCEVAEMDWDWSKMILAVVFVVVGVQNLVSGLIFRKLEAE